MAYKIEESSLSGFMGMQGAGAIYTAVGATGLQGTFGGAALGTRGGLGLASLSAVKGDPIPPVPCPDDPLQPHCVPQGASKATWKAFSDKRVAAGRSALGPWVEPKKDTWVRKDLPPPGEGRHAKEAREKREAEEKGFGISTNMLLIGGAVIVGGAVLYVLLA